MEHMIEVTSLKKSYGKLQAVKGIDFSVEKGSLFAFLGPNGAGKSTTIDILCTLGQFDEGTVKIAGYDLKHDAEQIRRQIGVVFQESLLDKQLTVKENLSIRAGFYHKSESSRKSAVEQAIQYAEVADFVNQKYGTLSGGQRRRVDIARALLNTPQILFLDEPTTGLDPQTRKHIWETVTRLQKENGMTIFLTTHYMEEAAKADYVVIIDKGQIVARGTPYTLKEQYSSEHVRIMPKAGRESEIIRYLKKLNLNFVSAAEILDVNVKSTLDALDMLQPIRDAVESFEVLYGTMDDVFLNITGRELRE